MNGTSSPIRRQRGAVLLEFVVASVAALVVIGGLLSSAVAIRRSIVATNQYTVSAANETRLMDYVAQDLRRAVRVAMLYGNTSTPMKNYDNFYITETNVLAINIPDYYGANVPDNSAASAYKTSRYPRASLNSASAYNSNAVQEMHGVVPWTEAVTTLNGREVTRFAPTSAGTGEIQVRYYRATSSPGDSSVSFYRAEYPSGATTPSQVRQIAERISDNLSTTHLTVTGKNDGLIFRLRSSFSPRYRLTGSTTAGTEAFVEVSTRNPRRD